MNDLLLILAPRAIPECVESLRVLEIDKAWLGAMYERHLETVVAEVIASTDYENYLMASDDLLVTPEALAEVREQLAYYPVVTGYCRYSYYDPEVNLCLTPEGLDGGEEITVDLVKTLPRLFRTYLVGWTLTGMRRDLWLRFPFRACDGRFAMIDGREVDIGFSSDMNLSRRLRDAGVTIMAARDAYCEHWNGKAGVMGGELLMGRIRPYVLFEG
jgi:hypothetical protein